MYFDDRLATVLRVRASGERAAKTQFRQLIDLLGERPQAGDRALKAAAYLRLIALGELIPPKQRAAIVGELGWRFRNPELVAWFGEAHPHIAAAALYRAQLRGNEWAELIPKLPIRARGFLRHRRDLPHEAVMVLDQLGVSDRGLPQPEPLELMEELSPPGDRTNPEPPRDAPGKTEVKSLVERIESFRRTRQSGSDQQPADHATTVISHGDQKSKLDNFLFGADYEGRIDWAEQAILPMVYRIDLTSIGSSALARAIARRQPIRDTMITLRGAERIEGEWIIDAIPRFTRNEGRFLGYGGRLRRPVAASQDRRGAEADRLRQLLHELRTPVNAMQGYAEIIQQQMIGPVPHEYRSIAATIAGDAAHILAGFEELDRLARLEAGALDLEDGEADFAAIARRQIMQLQTVLSPRVARFDADLDDTRAPVALAPSEVEMLSWRLLATLAGAVGAGEAVRIAFDTENEQVELAATLPATLRESEDIFSVQVRATTGALSAGIFGAGFSLRLARAEARAAGGDLLRDGDRLVFTLPLVAASARVPNTERAIG